MKNLLGRTRTEIVGLALFYGKAGFGKSRWAFKTAIENGYIYHRLESNATVKDFLKALLTKLHNSLQSGYMDIHNRAGGKSQTQNELSSQILDILQQDQNLVIFVDECDYGFQNKKILASVRDFVDESLATFVLIGMEQAKAKLKQMNQHYFDRCGDFFEFKEATIEDTELILKKVCEVDVDSEIIKYINTKSKGTLRILNKYIEALDRIGKRAKKEALSFDEIKDIITKFE